MSMTDSLIYENEDWSGWLIRPKKEWLNPGEEPHPYVVIEDRGPRVLVQLLPQYQSKNRTFPVVESGFKDWYEVIDKNIQKV
jgi:hypothetical protein